MFCHGLLLRRPCQDTLHSPGSFACHFYASYVLLAVAVVSFTAIPVRPGEDSLSAVLAVEPLALVRTAVEIVDERLLPLRRCTMSTTLEVALHPSSSKEKKIMHTQDGY